MYDVIIIGAGPAGLTAAIYLRRANKSVLVLDGKGFGGAIVNTNRIDNYPGCYNISGFDFANNLYNGAKDLGAIIKFEEVIDFNNGKIKEVITKKNKYTSKAVIIATGKESRKLGFEDEYIGKGVSYCAMCDGAFYKDKIVAVVGGGNSAIDDVLYLADIAKKVYLIHRRDEFRADKKSLDLLKKKNNIKYVLNSNITKLNGKDHLESVEVKTIDKTKKFNIDGLFIAIGGIPSTKLFKGIVSLNRDGYVKGNNCHTNKHGIFAAGDAREKEVRQLVTATSDGAIAAIEAIKYLNK
jgi:thioredoxin reductase (NADPH)